jgi:predicted RNase H-like nuclease (RuvC/YqgF family)
MQEVYKRKIKEYRRTVRDTETECSRLEQENKSLAEMTKQLKVNSEHLMQDLVKQ